MAGGAGRPWQAGKGAARPPMDGIGYRQLALARDGRITEDEALRLMIRDTTRYAKRQLTWFQREPEIRWLDVDEAGGVEGTAQAAHKVITGEGLIEGGHARRRRWRPCGSRRSHGGWRRRSSTSSGRSPRRPGAPASVG